MTNRRSVREFRFPPPIGTLSPQPAAQSIRRESFARTFFTGVLFPGASARVIAQDSSVLLSGSQCYLCTTCGMQYAASEQTPATCPVCEDERQYVGPNGHQWTTLEALRVGHWENTLTPLENNLVAIATEPKFAIGQRALLVRSPTGNILWDCISFLDEATVQSVRDLGGVKAIAISHPHYYTSMVEWSRAFGDVPIYLHEDDRRWVMRPDSRIQFWSGETKALSNTMTLLRLGGHFDGYQALHWSGGADGRGALLSGDLPQVCADSRWVSFMYSYPNYIPLNAPAVQRIVNRLEPYRFDRIYGAFFPGIVQRDAKQVIHRSADRYLARIA